MTGGHFLIVGISPEIPLWLFSGRALNHSGRPRTAGTGRGRIASSSGGQRKMTLCWSASSMGFPIGHGCHVRLRLARSRRDNGSLMTLLAYLAYVAMERQQGNTIE